MAGFDEFWSVYPRKIDKALARAKYQAITGSGLKTRILEKDSGMYMETELKATPDEILEGAKAYAWDNINTESRYIKHPSTWLNRQCWDDLEPTWRKAKAEKFDELHSRDNLVEFPRPLRPGPLKGSKVG